MGDRMIGPPFRPTQLGGVAHRTRTGLESMDRSPPWANAKLWQLWGMHVPNTIGCSNGSKRAFKRHIQKANQTYGKPCFPLFTYVKFYCIFLRPMILNSICTSLHIQDLNPNMWALGTGTPAFTGSNCRVTLPKNYSILGGSPHLVCVITLECSKWTNPSTPLTPGL